MNIDMFLESLATTINDMQLHKRLHKTVDFNGKWDGTLAKSQFHKRVKTFSGTTEERYTYHIPLTYGLLIIKFTYDMSVASLNCISFSYVIPKYSDYGKIMYGNQISRQVYSGIHGKSQAKVRKLITSKASGLMDAIDEWYKNSLVRDIKDNRGSYSPAQISNYYTYLFEAVGRARLLSRIHLDTMAKYATAHDNSERIDELANELLELTLEQRNLHPQLL